MDATARQSITPGHVRRTDVSSRGLYQASISRGRVAQAGEAGRVGRALDGQTIRD